MAKVGRVDRTNLKRREYVLVVLSNADEQVDSIIVSQLQDQEIIKGQRMLSVLFPEAEEVIVIPKTSPLSAIVTGDKPTAIRLETNAPLSITHPEKSKEIPDKFKRNTEEDLDEE